MNTAYTAEKYFHQRKSLKKKMLTNIITLKLKYHNYFS